MSRINNTMENLMGWLKLETNIEEEEEMLEESPQSRKTMLYLKPEALKHIVAVDDFDRFQSSAEFIEGGRLIEVNKQFNYKLRQVVDLIEEPLHTVRQRPHLRSVSSAPKSPTLRPEALLHEVDDSESLLTRS